MSQLRNVGPVFNLQIGQTVTWSISYGAGQDAGIVIGSPNIHDFGIDPSLNSVVLVAQNQGVGKTRDSRLFYTVDIHNRSVGIVNHNLNLQDWF
jgi:hypothetical protein